MDWNRWRQEFPITQHLTHFNHAGVSPVSRRVAAAVTAFADEALVVDAAIQRRWDVRAEEIRAAFARLVGAQADEIAFVKNTSEGLSLIAVGLDWRAGDNVIAVDGRGFSRKAKSMPSASFPASAARDFKSAISRSVLLRTSGSMSRRRS